MAIINRKKSGAELLEELREAYENEQVSALIGSGFSKNASKSFPLWSDLLADIVVNSISTEILTLCCFGVHRRVHGPQNRMKIEGSQQLNFRRKKD